MLFASQTHYSWTTISCLALRIAPVPPDWKMAPNVVRVLGPPSSCRVAPDSHALTEPTLPQPAASHPRHRILRLRLLQLYNLGIWGLLSVTLFAQSFGVIWSSVVTKYQLYYGQSPLLGKYSIPGFNDEPYSDRTVVCERRGYSTRPVQLSRLLLEQSGVRKSTTTSGINGYRVVSRDSFTMDAAEFSFYVRQCNTLSLALENVFLACSSLGYNVSQDYLRVVDGIDSVDVLELPSILPVLIIPYWDKGALSRYIVPGRDGSACVFRGGGKFERETDSTATMSAVTRSIREARTVQMLGYPGGVWRNGWYEDPVVRMRWYSDVISTVPNGEWGVDLRRFELLDNARELDCSQAPYGCGGGIADWNWGDAVHMSVDLKYFHSIAISNGSRFGLFLFDALHVQTITSRYSLSKFISNGSFVMILAHWMAAMIALSPTDTIGIAAVANSQSFQYLPFFLLPRLKSTLDGFWTSGCFFDGDQHALGDSWFEIYPAIGEFVMIFFSLLNAISKISRRRTSDVLFGPTLVFFGLLHYFRFEIAAANVLEFDSRVVAVITAADIESASILDFFTTDLAFRTNGKATSLFAMKLAVLGLNLLPLLLASRRMRPTEAKTGSTLHVEEALAMIFGDSGGLGSTATPYLHVDLLAPDSTSTRVCRPYELVRARKVLVGTGSSRLLMAVDHWFVVLATLPFRHVKKLAFRVVIYEAKQTSSKRIHGDALDEVWTVSSSPQIVTVSDPQLAKLVSWRISTAGFR